MTASVLNPFPDYAVTRLTIGQSPSTTTVVTQPIALARKLVEAFLAGVSVPLQPGQTNAALCAIRGDYGTGKTHLLNDAAAHLADLRKDASSPSILRVTCIETDPLSWYRTKVGPQLDQPFLTDVALHLYGRSGKAVAAATPLTESAAEVLEQDPTRIRDLVRENRLSVDEVSREFNKALAEICKGYDATVRRVLSRLLWGETENAARAWIRGETLAPRDAELLGVPPSIATAEQASAVIGSIAAIHKAVQRPFVMLVDELEHFTRFAKAQGTESNFTWLKRLLEELGNAGALALVAGHWTAWETAKDYLDRFPQYAPIDLVKLEPDEVMEIITARLKTLPADFGADQARLIATVTAGNMRRLMSLCNVLFRETNGFSAAPTESQIHAAWSSLAQRIPSEQAVARIGEMLEARGFDVAEQGQLGDLPFDLVARHDDGRAIVVYAKHSITQSQHYDAARQFMDKIATATKRVPGVIGLFLANGSVDDELGRILGGGRTANIRWFDLTTRDAMAKIEGEIQALDDDPRHVATGVAKKSAPPLSMAATPASQGPPGPAGPAGPPGLGAADSAELRAMNAKLEQQLQDLDARRYLETQDLKQRLDKLMAEVGSPRDVSLQKEGQLNAERERASYEALLEGPSLTAKLRYLRVPLRFGIVLDAVGVLAIISALSDMLHGLSAQYYAAAKFSLIAFGIALVLLSSWRIWSRYLQVAEYFEFIRQTISDLYLRDVPVKALALVNRAFRRSLEEYGSTYYARRHAIERLVSVESIPPTVSQYLTDPR